MRKWFVIALIIIAGAGVYQYVATQQRQQDACTSLAVSTALEHHRYDRGEPVETAKAEEREARALSAHCYGLKEDEVKQ